jgi:hypothetical protein
MSISSQAADNLPKNLRLISSKPKLWGWMEWAPGYLGTFVWAGTLSGVVQYLSDYSNPYLTQDQIWARTRIAAAGGGASAVFALAVGGAIASSETGIALGLGGGVPGVIFGATVGFVTGLAYFGIVQPIIFERAGQNPKRNLAPFSSP